MSARPKTPAEVLRDQAKVSRMGNELLTTGLAVGAIGVAGAALGAVCPLCVVATPALLGLGVVQKLRARFMRVQPAEPEAAAPATTE